MERFGGSEQGCEVEPACGPRELHVERPEFRARQRCGRQKVRIDPADSRPHEAMSFDERQRFVVRRRDDRRELSQEMEHVGTLREIAARQLAHDERMRSDLTLLEEGFEPRVAVSKVIDPDRSVDEHYPFFLGRRRGTERRRG